MDQFPLVIVGVVIAGVAFDFVNGFHDAANSIATIVATRVLKPWQAVLWAAFFNVVAVFFFGIGVAKTMGAGLISLEMVTPEVILCGLIGATLWGLLTWRLGLPTSSSHGLLGGYAGSAMGYNIFIHGWRALGSPIIASGWIKVLAFIIVAPVLGLFLAQILTKILVLLQERFYLRPKDVSYKGWQLFSSAFLSLMHGSNDAQKTAGIMTGALMSAGLMSSFVVPPWVLALSYGTMGLGTLFGGWRIVRTMGHKLTRLTPMGAVCAQGAAALSILGATLLDLPISTTHVTTGAIMGVGVATDPARVRWTVGRRIAIGWVFTIPAAALIGFSVISAITLMTR